MSDISDARQCTQYKILESETSTSLTMQVDSLLKEVVKDSYAVFRWIPYGPLQVVKKTEFRVLYVQAMVLVYDRYLMPSELREELDKVKPPETVSFLESHKTGETKLERDPITSFILS